MDAIRIQGGGSVAVVSDPQEMRAVVRVNDKNVFRLTTTKLDAYIDMLLSVKVELSVEKAKREAALEVERDKVAKHVGELLGKSGKQKFVVIAAVDTDEVDAGYGVMRQDTWVQWCNMEVEPDIQDRFGLLYGNSELVDTYDSFEGVMQAINDAEGEIAGIHACLAY